MDLIQAPFAVLNSTCLFENNAQWRRHGLRASALGFLHGHGLRVRTLLFSFPGVPNSLSLSSVPALALSPPAAQSCPPIVSILLRRSASSSRVWHGTRTHAAVDLPQSTPQMSCRIAGCICANIDTRSDRVDLRIKGTLHGTRTYTLNCTVNPR